MKPERRIPVQQARILEGRFARKINESLRAPGGTVPLRRGNLLTNELVQVARNTCAQQRVNPWEDGGVIGEETATKASAPPVVSQLQGEIVVSPLDLDEDAGERIVAERLRPGVGVLPLWRERRPTFTHQVAESHDGRALRPRCVPCQGHDLLSRMSAVRTSTSLTTACSRSSYRQG